MTVRPVMSSFMTWSLMSTIHSHYFIALKKGTVTLQREHKRGKSTWERLQKVQSHTLKFQIKIIITFYSRTNSNQITQQSIKIGRATKQSVKLEKMDTLKTVTYEICPYWYKTQNIWAMLAKLKNNCGGQRENNMFKN